MLRDAAATPPDAEAAFKPNASPAPNYLRMLWQRKLLLIVGGLIGGSVGFWHNSQQPPTYKSSARFQLVEPAVKQVPVQGVEAAAFAEDATEQIMIMRSETIMKRAAELGNLQELTEFLNLPPGQVGLMLSTSSKFSVRSLGRTTYEIAYVADTPDTPLRVLQAVNDAYAEHLEKQKELIGAETLTLIEDARGEVLQRLEALEADFDKFKRETPLVYRNGEMSSVHRDYADNYLRQKQALVLRQTEIVSKLAAAKQAIDGGDDSESVLLLLGSDANAELQNLVGAVLMTDVENRPVVDQEDGSNGRALLTVNGRGAASTVLPREKRSVALRREALFPLQMQEEELLREVGVNHPSVSRLQSRMRMVEAQIKRTEQSEAEYERQLLQISEAKILDVDQETDESLTAEERQKRYEISIQRWQEKQLRLVMLALEQQKKLIEHELQVIEEAYDYEVVAMADERTAELQHDRMTREIERQQTLYDRIVGRLDEISIMSESAGVRISTLSLPRLGSKVTAIQSRSLFLGTLLGFASTAGICLLLGISDKSYHSAEEIAAHLRAPVLGHIPYVPRSRFLTKLAPLEGSQLNKMLHTFHRPKNWVSEAYKALRTALFFSDQGGDSKVLLVTSAAPSEGKSTIAGNIAITIAQSGKSVLLVDADLRRPNVGKLFGIEAEKGLAWAVTELAANKEKGAGFSIIAEAIQQSEMENISIIPAGEKVENPAEILTSTSLETFIDLVRNRFDMVIIDSPPLLAVTDPSNIAPRVDGVIMVVRLGKQTRPRAAQAHGMLETLGANLVGIVVNGVGAKEAGYYGRYGSRDGYYNGGFYRNGYGYSYGYSYQYGEYDEYYEQDEKRNGGRKRRKKAAEKV
ncbi:MAG: polysaccharide biosynthesis tyrosine autokinase [Rubripirellula sp.]